MSQINLEEKIAENLRFDYRERLKKIQTNIKNNRAISRIDEIYLQKVLDIDSLPTDFIKKNEILRKKDVYHNKKPDIVSKIISERTENAVKDDLYRDKLKSEIKTKEIDNTVSNQKKKFDNEIVEYKNTKETIVTNLQNELNNIKSKMHAEQNNVEKQEKEIMNLNQHYEKIISELNGEITNAKTQYDDIIKKRESLMRDMQLLKNEYDIATKRRNELETDLNSEKNIEVAKTKKITETVEQILVQNKFLNEQLKTETELKNKNTEELSQIEQRIRKLDSLLKVTTNLSAYINEQKSRLYEIVKENERYRMQFDQKMISVEKMKKSINENFELLSDNFKKNN